MQKEFFFYIQKKSSDTMEIEIILRRYFDITKIATYFLENRSEESKAAIAGQISTQKARLIYLPGLP